MTLKKIHDASPEIPQQAAAVQCWSCVCEWDAYPHKETGWRSESLHVLPCLFFPTLAFILTLSNSFLTLWDSCCSCCRGPIYFTKSLRQYDIRCCLTTNKKHLVMTLHTHNKKLYWENVLCNAIANLEMEDWHSYGPWGISTNSNLKLDRLGTKKHLKKKLLLNAHEKIFPF